MATAGEERSAPERIAASDEPRWPSAFRSDVERGVHAATGAVLRGHHVDVLRVDDETLDVRIRRDRDLHDLLRRGRALLETPYRARDVRPVEEDAIEQHAGRLRDLGKKHRGVAGR